MTDSCMRSQYGELPHSRTRIAIVFRNLPLRRDPKSARYVAEPGRAADHHHPTSGTLVPVSRRQIRFARSMCSTLETSSANVAVVRLRG